MEASTASDGRFVVSMSEAEVIVLHELIAFAEFASDLEVIVLDRPEDRKVCSDVQQALSHLIPELGTGRYGVRLRDAYAEIDAAPY